MKSIFGSLAVVIIVLEGLYIFYLQECNKCPGTVTAAATTTKVVAHNDTGAAYTPVPVKVDSSKPIGATIKWKTEYVPIELTDTVKVLVQGPPQKVDTMAILRKYFNTYSYHEENYKKGDKFSDSMRKKYGYVAADIEVTQNRILSMNWTNHLLSTETTTTKTVSKNQVYVGLGIYGNKTNPISGIDLDLYLKTKTDHMYNAGVLLLPNGPYYHAGADWKIQLKK